MNFILQYPGHRDKALTFSYDDGQSYDRRLAALFRQYGLKATFHLNSAHLGAESFVGEEQFVRREELTTLYEGQEIACHGAHHAFPFQLSQTALASEYAEDRRTLEQVTGRIIRGCSYAYGEHSAQVKETLRALGFSYCRTTGATGEFGLPRDFLEWHPTCHHSAAFSGELAERFLNPPRYRRATLLYIWGHSFEFEHGGQWAEMERLCASLAGREDVWYATNQEIADYVTAARSLIFSLDGTRVQNPTAARIDCLFGGRPLTLEPGREYSLCGLA